MEVNINSVRRYMERAYGNSGDVIKAPKWSVTRHSLSSFMVGRDLFKDKIHSFYTDTQDNEKHYMHVACKTATLIDTQRVIMMAMMCKLPTDGTELHISITINCKLL